MSENATKNKAITPGGTLKASFDETFNVSFNLPARRNFFDTFATKGLRFKIDGSTILIRPVEGLHAPDALAVKERDRGGYDVVVTRDAAPAMLDVLMKSATPARPFFILARSDQKGWVGIQHHSSDHLPSKFLPHMRVRIPWTRREDADAPAVQETVGHSRDLMAQFSDMMREAIRMVSSHATNRKLGRPPREIMQARETISMFERLAVEILPDRFKAGVDPIRLVSMRAMLEAAIAEASPDAAANASRSRRPAVVEDIVTTRARPPMVEPVAPEPQASVPIAKTKPSKAAVAAKPKPFTKPSSTPARTVAKAVGKKSAGTIRPVSMETIVQNVRSFEESSQQCDLEFGEIVRHPASEIESTPPAEIPEPVEQPVSPVPEIVPPLDVPADPAVVPVAPGIMKAVSRAGRAPLAGTLSLSSLRSQAPVAANLTVPEPVAEPVTVEKIVASEVPMPAVPTRQTEVTLQEGDPDFVEVCLDVVDLAAVRCARESGTKSNKPRPGPDATASAQKRRA